MKTQEERPRLDNSGLPELITQQDIDRRFTDITRAVVGSEVTVDVGRIDLYIEYPDGMQYIGNIMLGPERPPLTELQEFKIYTQDSARAVETYVSGQQPTRVALNYNC